VGTFPGSTHLKFVSLAISELLTFKAQKNSRDQSRDPGHALFQNFVRGHVETLPGSMLIKSEVHIFSHFGDIRV